MHITKKHMKVVAGIVVLALLLTVGLPYSGLSWTALAQYGTPGGTSTAAITSQTGNGGATYQLLGNGVVVITVGGTSINVNTSTLVGRSCDPRGAGNNVAIAPGVTAYATGFDIATGACVWQLNVGLTDDTAEVWVFPNGQVQLRKRA